MLLATLTGGIGSGKSTVAGAFAERGAAIIEADAIGRQILEPGGLAYQAVVDHFGSGVVRPDGSINRPALAAAVFNDPDALAELNRLTHPVIARVMDDRRRRARAARSDRDPGPGPSQHRREDAVPPVRSDRGGHFRGRRRAATRQSAGVLRGGRRGPGRLPDRRGRNGAGSPTWCWTTAGTDARWKPRLTGAGSGSRRERRRPDGGAACNPQPPASLVVTGARYHRLDARVQGCL